MRCSRHPRCPRHRASCARTRAGAVARERGLRIALAGRDTAGVHGLGLAAVRVGQVEPASVRVEQAGPVRRPCQTALAGSLHPGTARERHSRPNRRSTVEEPDTWAPGLQPQLLLVRLLGDPDVGDQGARPGRPRSGTAPARGRPQGWRTPRSAMASTATATGGTGSGGTSRRQPHQAGARRNRTTHEQQGGGREEREPRPRPNHRAATRRRPRDRRNVPPQRQRRGLALVRPRSRYHARRRPSSSLSVIAGSPCRRRRRSPRAAA